MRRHHSGITMVELLVVVTIVGILAGVALPSYRNQTLRANRVEAKTALQQATQALEKCFTRQRSYLACTGSVATGDTPGKLYNITVDATVTTYTLKAKPINGQAADTACDTLQIDQAGARTASASNPNKCW